MARIEQTVNVKIVTNPPEIRGGQVIRFGWFEVHCIQCSEILLSGKAFREPLDDLIWEAIRAHYAEHAARQTAGGGE